MHGISTSIVHTSSNYKSFYKNILKEICLWLTLSVGEALVFVVFFSDHEEILVSCVNCSSSVLKSAKPCPNVHIVLHISL